MSEERQRRTGGRSARVRDAVYAAVGTLSGSGELATMTIPRVAEIAGVNPSSVYRRWGSIDELREEVAVAALTGQNDAIPDTGALESDLAAWGIAIVADISRDSRRTYLRAMVAARTEYIDECPCMAQRATQAVGVIARAAERGEPVPTPTQIINHLVAPLYHRVVFGIRIDDALAVALAHEVAALARAQAQPRPLLA